MRAGCREWVPSKAFAALARRDGEMMEGKKTTKEWLKGKGTMSYEERIADLELQLEEAHEELKPLKEADAVVQEACRLMDAEIEQAGGLIPLLNEKIEVRHQLKAENLRLREVLEKYRQEYENPCPDLMLRTVYRRQLWKLLDEANDGGQKGK